MRTNILPLAVVSFLSPPASAQTPEVSIDSGLFEATLEASRRHRAAGQWNDGIAALLESSIELAAHASDPARTRTRLSLELARIRMHRGELETARQLVEEALVTAREIGDQSSISVSHYLRSNLLDDTEASLAEAEAALAAAREADDWALIVQATWGVGSVREARGELAEALERFEQAVALAERRGVEDESVVEALFHAGHVEDRKGDATKALGCYRRASDAARAFGVTRLLAFAPYHMGRIHHERLNDPDAAIPRLEEAVRILEGQGLGGYFLVPIALQRIGDIYFERPGELETARRFYRRAVQVAEAHGHERIVQRARERQHGTP